MRRNLHCNAIDVWKRVAYGTFQDRPDFGWKQDFSAKTTLPKISMKNVAEWHCQLMQYYSFSYTHTMHSIFHQVKKKLVAEKIRFCRGIEFYTKNYTVWWILAWFAQSSKFLAKNAIFLMVRFWRGSTTPVCTFEHPKCFLRKYLQKLKKAALWI